MNNILAVPSPKDDLLAEQCAIIFADSISLVSDVLFQFNASAFATGLFIGLFVLPYIEAWLIKLSTKLKRRRNQRRILK